MIWKQWYLLADKQEQTHILDVWWERSAEETQQKSRFE